MPETYKSFGTILGTTAATSIYAGVTGTALVNAVNVSNVNATTSTTITVEMLKGSTAYSIISNVYINPGTSLQVLDAPLVLESGNSLRATSGLTGYFHTLVSVLEIT
jgi:hypothetical protein